MARESIIFDFDGVIADTYSLNWGIVKELHPETDEVAYRINHHLGNVYEAPVVGFTPDSIAQFTERYTAQLSVAHVVESLPALKALAERYQFHVVSSNCEDAIKGVLAKAGVSPHFGHILGQETHKSKVHKFQYIEEREGILLSDVHFLTDTLGDLREASAVGLSSFAVTFGYHPRELLLQGAPKGVFENWKEVLDALL